jgi:hypothetical protein
MCVLSFQYAGASNEVKQTGSGRNAFVAEEANRLGVQALVNRRELSERPISQASPAHAAANHKKAATRSLVFGR